MTDSEIDLCLIGIASTDKDCHKTWYRKDKGFRMLGDLTH